MRSFFVGILLLGCASKPHQPKSVAYRRDTMSWFDAARQRVVPVALYQPMQAMDNTAIVIFSHGYGQNKGGDYLAYSYLTEYLAGKGYFVVSIQHELPTDSLMPTTGIVQIVRRPFWERGADNIWYVLNELKLRFPRLDFQRVALIGHSNGGDISALFPQKYPNWVKKVITLDHRRMPLPRQANIEVYSLRSNDQLPDAGVLPAADEPFPIKVVFLPNTSHHQMDDQASPAQAAEITRYVEDFLKDFR